MRITNAMRDRIADAVMADVPTTNHAALGRAELVEAAVAALPAKVRAVWSNPETQAYIRVCRLYGDIPAAFPSNCDEGISSLPDEARRAYAERKEAAAGEKARRAELRKSVMANLRTVNTDHALSERFPELARYLPGCGATANLPATNDLAERLKAAGWVPTEEDA